MKFIKELEWRKLTNQIANKEYLESMAKEGASFYIGIDPTANSIHIGHYMSIVASKHLANAGFRPVFVIGGLTASIGDPSGKNEERPIVNKKIIATNSIRIEKIIIELADKLDIKDFKIINNMTFYKDMSIIELLQKYGKLFNINTMLSKESVQKRTETGISFTEFSYQIFQAIDFLRLYEQNNVKLQLGGSDQWGNMVAGLELIRKIHGANKKVSVITFNLITDSEGNKIGKTAGNPIWLDKKLFSSYNLFQYILNKKDEEAKKLLIKLTFINEKEFLSKIKEQKEKPSSKPIQNELAKRLISMIHSPEDYINAHESSLALFNEEYEKLDPKQYEALFNGIPILEKSEESIMKIVTSQGTVQSNRQFRELMINRAVKMNGIVVNDEKQKIIYLKNKISIIQLGKKKKYIIWK